jgi:hypothetical protein
VPLCLCAILPSDIALVIEHACDIAAAVSTETQRHGEVCLFMEVSFTFEEYYNKLQSVMILSIPIKIAHHSVYEQHLCASVSLCLCAILPSDIALVIEHPCDISAVVSTETRRGTNLHE